jgi:hypothetical protein
MPKWATPIALCFLKRGYNWLTVRCSGDMRGNMPGEFVRNNLTQEFKRIRSGSVEVVRGHRNMKDAGRKCIKIFSWKSPYYRNATVSYLKKLGWELGETFAGVKAPSEKIPPMGEFLMSASVSMSWAMSS